MPSPIGHALAGLAIGWSASRPEPSDDSRPAGWSLLALGCVLAAAAPDLDLLYPPIHRTVTHSVGATLLVIIITAAVTGKVTGRIAWRIVLALAAAHASHILLDWLGTDRFPPPGIRALWPFSNHFYISGWEVFPNVERRLWRPDALAVNVHAALMEILIVGPVTAAVWLATRTRRNRVRTSGPDARRPPSVEAADTDGTWDRQGPRAAR